MNEDMSSAKSHEANEVYTIPRAPDGSLRPSIADAEKRYGSIHDYYSHVILGDVQCASEFITLYLPEVAREFDATKLTILSNEVYDNFLGKKVLDIVYELPSRTHEPPLNLTLIVEHKSWGGVETDYESLNQLLGYFSLICQRRYADWKSARRSVTTHAQAPQLAQPLVALVYTGKSETYEPPRFGDHYPLPSSLDSWKVRFPIMGVNLTRLYRENRLVGSSFVRNLGALLSSANLGELPTVYKRLFESYNEVDEWGAREEYLVKSSFAYADKALKNLGSPITYEDALDINANLHKEEARNVMNSYFDELELKGERKGLIRGMIRDKIESICSFVEREFDNCPPELRANCVQINDFSILEQIWNFALFKAQSLDELMAFVDERVADAKS